MFARNPWRKLAAAFALAAALVLGAPLCAQAAGPVALDPGHGGTDSGAVGGSLYEKNLTWKIATYCGDRLIGTYKIPVVFTKDQSSTLNSLVQRIENAVAKDARVIVSIHINSAETTTARGVETWVPHSGSNWNRFTVVEGAAFGTDVNKRLCDGIFTVNRGNKTSTRSGTYADGSAADYLGMLCYPRRSGVTGVLVECGFISNPADRAILSSDDKLKAIGYAIADAIAAQWPNSYVRPALSVVPTQSGWVKNSSGWRYLQNNEPLTGWQTIDGKRYFFNGSGYMATGWQKLSGSWYYFGGSEDGALKTGWQHVGGCWYYLNPQTGVMHTGWLQEGGRKYYLTSSGAMLGAGWHSLGGAWYWMESSGAVRENAWLATGGQRYWLKPGGAMATAGWNQVQNVWYWMQNSGAVLQNSWLKRGSVWYWLGTEGRMAEKGTAVAKGTLSLFAEGGAWQSGSGWRKVAGTWYWLNNDVVRTGWLNRAGTWYLLGSNGAMLTGWQTVGGARYYLNAPNGDMVTGWQTIDGSRYLFASSGAMLTGWQKVSGTWYLLGSNGAMLTGWQTVGGKRYYLQPSTGAMVTGTQTIDGQTYTFASSGELMVNNQVLVEEARTGWTDANGNPSDPNKPSTKVKLYDSNGALVWTRTTNTPIMGASVLSRDTFVKNFSAKLAPNYPASVYKDKGAATATDFAQAAWDAAVSEGVRPEVLAAQVANETGWLRFGGIVNANQCNFGGLGALDGNANGNAATFSSVQEGLLAQAQHLKAYATSAPLNQACVDPRFNLVSPKGKAPYVEDLGWGMWASTIDYNVQLLNLMRTLGA